VPVGFNKHKEKQDGGLMPKGFSVCPIVDIEFENACLSLGTLGGGNHFIEIQKGSDGHIWIMIHSGSRNLGFKVANYYNKLAQGLNEKWHSSVPKSWELAFLPVDSVGGQNYIKEMNYCVEFALANRKLIMDRVLEIFDKETKRFNNITAQKLIGSVEPMINIAHNYASLENHFGQNVWVHRKGATKATKGLVGIIPGSLGSPSYITQGLGNKNSFCSSPHGAGRKMSRKRAKEKLSLKNEIEILDRQNIIHGIRNQQDLDEATGSYKNIDEVMKNSKDLVKILVRLQPLASIKG